MVHGSRYQQVQAQLRAEPKAWLITGVAGFIGSNLLEALLKLGQRVVGLDNFSTGHGRNLAQAVAAAGPAAASRFTLIEGDILDPDCCAVACHGTDFLLHHAADTSAPPGWPDQAPGRLRGNRRGYFNIMNAARKARVRRAVYAAGEADYDPELPSPRLMAEQGRPLSQWATGRYLAAIDSDACAGAYALPSIGLRYFNVFGPRQSGSGVHAGVIGHWLAALVNNPAAEISGSLECAGDFCFVDNIVQANLLAAVSVRPEMLNRVYPVGMGEAITLNRLLRLLLEGLVHRADDPATRLAGDRVLRESEICPDPATGYAGTGVAQANEVCPGPADISGAQRLLGYQPSHSVADGLAATIVWYYRELAELEKAAKRAR